MMFLVQGIAIQGFIAAALKGRRRRVALLVIGLGLAGCNAEDGVAAMAPDHPRCREITYLAPSGPQNNITFVFDEAYACGQFANGDWWVSPNQRGYVQIDAILPDASAGMNGHEVNPGDNSRQPFDQRVKGYDPALADPLPLRINGVASLVKAVSEPAGQTGKPCRPCLAFAAVLTIIGEPLAGSTEVLRPGYFGQAKSFYSLDGIAALTERQVSGSCCTTADTFSAESLKERYQGVQLDHLQGWNGRAMHPRDNMPDYGASIARDNAVAVLRMLLSDFDIGKALPRSALVNYLQMGVDLENMALNGVSWPAAGGHGNGRKLPLVFTSWLLADADFGPALSAASFSEDQQVYWGRTEGRALFGQKCTDSGYWSRMRTGAGAKDCRDPYGYIDGGGEDIGAAYQLCCTAKPWKYTALAVSMLGLEKAWDKPAFFNYVRRWVNHGVWSEPDPCAPFNGDPSAYRRAYGPDGAGDCIRGAGRSLATETGSRHGTRRDAGHYDAEFGDRLWAWYWRAR